MCWNEYLKVQCLQMIDTVCYSSMLFATFYEFLLGTLIEKKEWQRAKFLNNFHSMYYLISILFLFTEHCLMKVTAKNETSLF